MTTPTEWTLTLVPNPVSVSEAQLWGTYPTRRRAYDAAARAEQEARAAVPELPPSLAVNGAAAPDPTAGAPTAPILTWEGHPSYVGRIARGISGYWLVREWTAMPVRSRRPAERKPRGEFGAVADRRPRGRPRKIDLPVRAPAAAERVDPDPWVLPDDEADDVVASVAGAFSDSEEA